MLSNIISSLARELLGNYKINFSHLKFVVLSHSLLSAAPLWGMITFFPARLCRNPALLEFVIPSWEACSDKLLYQDSQDGNTGSSLLQSSVEAFFWILERSEHCQSIQFYGTLKTILIFMIEYFGHRISRFILNKLVWFQFNSIILIVLNN